MLHLVATPIGNLDDITLRAIDTLKTCDYILCEDTRHSLKLLNHFEIKKPLKSYHKFNEAKELESILQDLRDGKNIALISDAGTPGISDPGALLVAACKKEDLVVTSIPGPCAAISALACSGLDTTQFQFVGFVDPKTLPDLIRYSGTTIAYESPNRLISTLQLLEKIAPQRQITVARELTKKFEEVACGTASELLKRWEEVRGEIVIMIAGHKETTDWSSLSPLEHVQFLEQTYQLSHKDAIKLAAELRGVPKREIYNEIEK